MGKGRCTEATALTLTFREHWSPDPIKQFQTTIGDVVRQLHRCCDYYAIYPELRDHSGELHYHCTIIINDKIKYYKKVLPFFKRQGFIKAKGIFDIEVWHDYCKKNLKLMRKILFLNKQYTYAQIKGNLPITKENSQSYRTRSKSGSRIETAEKSQSIESFFQ